MMYDYTNVVLKEVEEPKKDCSNKAVILTDLTMINRKKTVLKKMEERNLDVLVIYADLEHGHNFEYLVGFLPRFEEALLVLHVTGEAYIVLGNENLNKSSNSRIEVKPIHAPHFSLPNQPMKSNLSFVEILNQTHLSGKRVGVAGWKNFTSNNETNEKLFDLPYFIVEALINLCGIDNLTNECSLFIGNNGVRRINNPNEIAHYEFGSSLASDCILDAIKNLKIGISEFEIGDLLNRFGQTNNVVTIAAFGPRYISANMYPTQKTLKLGDTVSLTSGYKGGLSSRSGYAVHDENELEESVSDYFEKVCAPYFVSIQALLENIRCGIKGGLIYDLVNKVLPQNEYNWGLCPGHLVADEEWMSSPIYDSSEELIQSGMIFQTDIIPSLKGYNGISMESTFLIADYTLRESIKLEYPDLWSRFENRRNYILNVTGINISDEILPMASTLTYMKPFFLSKKATVVKK